MHTRLAIHGSHDERQNIKNDWQQYVRALLFSLSLLPNFVGVVWRGVAEDPEKLKEKYMEGSKVFFSAFTSASRHSEMIIVTPCGKR